MTLRALKEGANHTSMTEKFDLTPVDSLKNHWYYWPLRNGTFGRRYEKTEKKNSLWSSTIFENQVLLIELQHCQGAIIIAALNRNA